MPIYAGAHKEQEVQSIIVHGGVHYIAYLANAYCVVNALIDEILEVNK